MLCVLLSKLGCTAAVIAHIGYFLFGNFLAHGLISGRRQCKSPITRGSSIGSRGRGFGGRPHHASLCFVSGVLGFRKLRGVPIVGIIGFGPIVEGATRVSHWIGPTWSSATRFTAFTTGTFPICCALLFGFFGWKGGAICFLFNDIVHLMFWSQKLGFS